jgi:hypothetical protein
MSKIFKGNNIECSEDKSGNLELHLTQNGVRQAIYEVLNYGSDDSVKKIQDLYAKNVVMYRYEIQPRKCPDFSCWHEINMPEKFRNDHDILRSLLGDVVNTIGRLDREIDFIYGDTVTLHGNFILSDKESFWYDNLYAIRDIVVDLIYNYFKQHSDIILLKA